MYRSHVLLPSPPRPNDSQRAKLAADVAAFNGNGAAK